MFCDSVQLWSGWCMFVCPESLTWWAVIFIERLLGKKNNSIFLLQRLFLETRMQTSEKSGFKVIKSSSKTMGHVFNAPLFSTSEICCAENERHSWHAWSKSQHIKDNDYMLAFLSCANSAIRFSCQWHFGSCKSSLCVHVFWRIVNQILPSLIWLLE